MKKMIQNYGKKSSQMYNNGREVIKLRRKEKEIQEPHIIKELLEKAIICRIGMCQSNKPYIVPMNFGYHDKIIYLHSAKEGKKINILKENPEICFEIESNTEIQASDTSCNWGMKYLRVIGWGKVEFIKNIQEKEEALNIIMKKHTGKIEHTFLENMIERVEIIKIHITKMTGKKSGF